MQILLGKRLRRKVDLLLVKKTVYQGKIRKKQRNKKSNKVTKKEVNKEVNKEQEVGKIVDTLFVRREGGKEQNFNNYYF